MSENRAAPAGAAHVLVVEDDEVMRLFVCEVLQGLGHRVEQAPNLALARQLISQNPISLVMSDIHLRDSESGVVLLRELAARSPEIAVVMMTANADIQVAIDCLRDGAFDYLLKPFTLDELALVITRVLQRQRQMIAERDRVEAQLRILGKFSSENPNPVLRVARDGQILYSNDAGQALLTHFGCHAGQRAPAFLSQFITDVFGMGKPGDIEVSAGGQIYSFAVTPIKDADFVYLYGHDITRLKETEAELIRLKDQAQELALHDVLTGLPNRMLLEDRLQQAVHQSSRSHKKLAVVFIDLDNFKEINDSYGHRAGDQVLISVAQSLRQAARRSDTVGRWGGDELIVLLPEIEDAQEARAICERLKSAAQRQLARDHITFPLSLSMGIAVCPDDADLATVLLQHADAALYLAKSRGRDEVVLFSESGEMKSFREKANLRALLSQAVAGGKIQVHYQPIVASVTGRPVGIEALARWHDDTLGWVPPATFIPLAEEMGLISALGRQVLDAAAQQFGAWKKQGFALSFSVNVSIRQIFKNDFLSDLLALTARCGLNPAEVILELTESQALLGLTSEFNRLDELNQSGFRLSIDDFGQGYSSLSSLHEMPVSELKIDMKFVRNLHQAKGRRILQAIVDLARSLGLETVAEGVEDETAVSVLKALGVHRLQGYLFGRPATASEVSLSLGNALDQFPGAVQSSGVTSNTNKGK